MPLTLKATAGASDSNSYLDVAGAQAILDGVPNTDAWDGADATEQAKALVYATSMLEALAFQGVKFTMGQALQWPRGGVIDPDYGYDASSPGYMTAGQWGVYLDYTLVPKRVKRACALLALEVLKAGTGDVWGVDPTVNVQREQVDVITTEYVDIGRRRYGLKALPTVWREVYPLLQSAEGRVAERA